MYYQYFLQNGLSIFINQFIWKKQKIAISSQANRIFCYGVQYLLTLCCPLYQLNKVLLFCRVKYYYYNIAEQKKTITFCVFHITGTFNCKVYWRYISSLSVKGLAEITIHIWLIQILLFSPVLGLAYLEFKATKKSTQRNNNINIRVK